MAARSSLPGGRPHHVDWMALPPAPTPRAPKAPSQTVHESSPKLTPEGQHIAIMLHRRSTGGTRREVQFKRNVSDFKSSMTGAKRAAKQRKRALLFPQKVGEEREKDTKKHRRARHTARAERDEEDLQQWPAFVVRLQQPCTAAWAEINRTFLPYLSEEVSFRKNTLNYKRRVAARLGVELEPPVPDNLPHEEHAARRAARSESKAVMPNACQLTTAELQHLHDRFCVLA